MQDMLDQYGAGIRVDQVQLQKVDPPSQVIDAFRDVQAARADKERLQNEASAYSNRIVPEARGEAERILPRRQGLPRAAVAEATGQTARFLKVYEEYKKAPEVTRRRMYLETMERVLGGTDKIIIDGRAADRAWCPTCRSTSCRSARKGATDDTRVSRLPSWWSPASSPSIAYFAFFIVHVNEQAIVLEFGRPVKIISQPGLFYKIPVVQTVDYFDKRILDLDTQPQEVTASDQKRIVVDTFARYRITDPLLFYQTRARRAHGALAARRRSSNRRCGACWAAPPSRTWCATSARP